VHIWRIDRKQFLSTTLEGVGAEKYGGRWNSRGARVVYCSATPELAALETLVHTPAKLMPKDKVLIKIFLPDATKIRRVTVKQLKADWNKYPPEEKTQGIGDRWVKRGRPLVLAVPSVLSLESFNYLLNAEHPDMRLVRVVSHRPLRLDPRFFGR